MFIENFSTLISEHYQAKNKDGALWFDFTDGVQISNQEIRERIELVLDKIKKKILEEHYPNLLVSKISSGSNTIIVIVNKKKENKYSISVTVANGYRYIEGEDIEV